MNIRHRLTDAIEKEVRNGIDPDSIAVMAHRVIWDMCMEFDKLHDTNRRRGKKISDIQTLINKKKFTERTAIEQRVLDIIFENGYFD